MTVPTPDFRLERLKAAVEGELEGLAISDDQATTILRHVDEVDFLDDSPPLVFAYRNWRGEDAIRHVKPIRFFYGATEHHQAPQWILVAHDLDRKADRDFAFRDILFVGDPLARIEEVLDRALQVSAEMVVEVPARDRRIAELLEANNRYQADGRRHKATAASFRIVLDAVIKAGASLRQGGPAEEDLQELSDTLEELVDLAGAAMDEADLVERTAKEAAT